MSRSIEINTENEQIVLGALINDPEALRRELPNLREEDFNYPNHREIVSALRELLRRGAGYAADTVVQVSREAVKLKYVRELEEGFDALTPENLAIHLELLRRDAVKFSSVESLDEVYNSMDDQHSTPAEVEGKALEFIKKIRSGGSGVDRVKRGLPLFREWYGDLEELHARRAENFRPLHFTGLDDKLYEGLRPGRVVVVAGRPGMGKSTFCSNLTLRLSHHGRKVLSVPVEAGTESVVEQMVCVKSRVEAEKIIKTPDELTEEEMFDIKRAAREILSNDRIVFDDEMYSIDDLEMAVEGEDFDVVILDLFEYLLQGELDAARVTADLRRVKKLSKRRGFATVVVQQIRRIKRKGNPRPMLHELKNSGGYEEVADLVLLIHREKYYDPDSEDEDVMEVKIAKQRRGPQNVTVGFEFHPEICRVGKHTDDYDASASTRGG